MTLPILPATIKLIKTKYGYTSGRISLSSGIETFIFLDHVYFKFIEDVIKQDEHWIYGTVYDIKTNELLYEGATTNIVWNNIAEWEYHNPVDLTKINFSELDEDSLIPEDLYKITV